MKPGDVDAEMVTVGEPGDFMVPLEVDGLPEQTLAIDYVTGDPRIVINGLEKEIKVETEWEAPTLTVSFEEIEQADDGGQTDA